MLSVDKKTGEVIVTPFSKFQHESAAMDVGSMLIKHQDFSWSEEIRDFIVVDGEIEDRQAYIDSFADDAGVYNVLKKYARTGDLSVLNRVEGEYLDISDLPSDELNPAALQAKAEASVAALGKALGKEITSEELSKMSAEDLNSLIAAAVEARTAKSEEVKKVGE